MITILSLIALIFGFYINTTVTDPTGFFAIAVVVATYPIVSRVIPPFPKIPLKYALIGSSFLLGFFVSRIIIFYKII